MPRHVPRLQIAQDVADDTANLLSILRRLSRLTRVKLLKTRDYVVKSAVLRCLYEVNEFIHNANSIPIGQREDVYEKSRVVDALSDLVSEDDFFKSSDVGAGPRASSFD